jgi:hypothetical protein
MCTYEEEGVGAPRERLGTLVEVVICGDLRELAAILVLLVLKVSLVLGLDLVGPDTADDDYSQSVLVR